MSYWSAITATTCISNKSAHKKTYYDSFRTALFNSHIPYSTAQSVSIESADLPTIICPELQTFRLSNWKPHF